MKKVITIIISIILISYILGVTFRLTENDLNTAVDMIKSSSPFSYNKVFFELDVLSTANKIYDASHNQSVRFDFHVYAEDWQSDDEIYNLEVMAVFYDSDTDTNVVTEYYLIDTKDFTGIEGEIEPNDFDVYTDFISLRNTIYKMYHHDDSVLLIDLQNILMHIVFIIFAIGYVILDSIIFIIPSIIGFIKALFYIIGL